MQIVLPFFKFLDKSIFKNLLIKILFIKKKINIFILKFLYKYLLYIQLINKLN